MRSSSRPPSFARLRKSAKGEPGLLGSNLYDEREEFFVAEQREHGYSFCAFRDAHEYLACYEEEEEASGIGDYRPTWNEVLLANRQLKPYLDLDLSGCSDPEQGDQVLEMVLDAYAENLRERYRVKLKASWDILVLKSHGETKEGTPKLSYHVVFPRYRVRDSEVCKWLCQGMLERLPEALRQYVDLGVYNANHNFRMINNYKYGDERLLEWQPEFRFRGTTCKTRVDSESDEQILAMVCLASFVQWTQQVGLQDKECRPLKVHDLPAPKVERVRGADSTLTDEGYRYACELWKQYDTQEALEPQDEPEGRFIRLKRVQPSLCEICSATHDHESQVLLVYPRGTVDRVVLLCLRDQKEKKTQLVLGERAGLLKRGEASESDEPESVDDEEEGAAAEPEQVPRIELTDLREILGSLTSKRLCPGLIRWILSVRGESGYQVAVEFAKRAGRDESYVKKHWQGDGVDRESEVFRWLKEDLDPKEAEKLARLRSCLKAPKRHTNTARSLAQVQTLFDLKQVLKNPPQGELPLLGDVISAFQRVVAYTDAPTPLWARRNYEPLSGHHAWDEGKPNEFLASMSMLEFKYRDPKLAEREKLRKKREAEEAAKKKQQQEEEEAKAAEGEEQEPKEPERCGYVHKKGHREGKACGAKLQLDKPYGLRCARHKHDALEKKGVAGVGQFNTEGVVTTDGKSFLKEHIEKFECCGFTFEPYAPGREVDTGKFRNLWTGYVAIPVKDPELSRFYWNNVLEVEACGDQEIYQYQRKLKCWRAQNPGLKSGVICWASGVQGCGKNSTIEPLFTHVFGRHCTMTLNKIDDMVGKFNGHLARTVQVLVNEVTSGDSSRQPVTDVIKSMATDEILPSEKKGIDKRMVRDHNDYTFLSNSDMIEFVEVNNRRFFAYLCSSKYVGDLEYWEDFYRQFKRPEVANALLWDLLNEDLTGFDPREFPVTSFMQRAIRTNTPAVVRFVEEAQFGCLDKNENFVKYGLRELRKDGRIKSCVAYQYFRAWREAIGERCTMKLSTFELKLAANFGRLLTLDDRGYITFLGEPPGDAGEVMDAPFSLENCSDNEGLPRIKARALKPPTEAELKLEAQKLERKLKKVQRALADLRAKKTEEDAIPQP